MSKSLNQAFIKAYSKEKATAAQRIADAQTKLAATQAQQAAAEQAAKLAVEASLFVRFDTATVAVPESHFDAAANSAKQRSPVANRPASATNTQPPASKPPAQLHIAQPHFGQAKTTPPRNPPANTSQSSTPQQKAVDGQPIARPKMLDLPTRQPQAAGVLKGDRQLRASIAAQMVQAGQWEQHAGAFLDRLPSLTQVPPATRKRPPAHSLTLEETILAHDSLSEGGNRQRQRSAERVVYRTSTRTVANSTEPRPLAPPSAPALQPQPARAQPPRPQPSNTQPPKTQPPKPQPQNPQAVARQAALPPDAPELPKPYIKPIVEQRSVSTPDTYRPAPSRATINRDGEIFRLDRPTYSSNDELAAMPADESEELSDEGQSGQSHTSVDMAQPDHISDKAVQNASQHNPDKLASSKARAVEEELRQAKLRIFNPVWEVDNLQWPEVCIELLEQSQSQMDQVAKNLASACEEGLQILAVTSPQGGEGCTTVACCLAILAGSRGLKVAIVDGDIDNPSLALQTNLEVEQDWRSAILDQLPIEEVAVHSIDDQVTLIPLLQPIDGGEMSADDDRIAVMLRELSDSFDLVIVDMGHMNSQRSLVQSMGEYGIISAVVAVVDHRDATAARIDNCIRKIRQAGVNSVGVVENFAA